jgi:hypothetical protein
MESVRYGFDSGLLPVPRQSEFFLVILVLQLLKNPLGEGRATPPQPLRLFLFFLAPPAPGPGLAAAQKSVRRGRSYATAAISAKTLFGATFGSPEKNAFL